MSSRVERVSTLDGSLCFYRLTAGALTEGGTTEATSMAALIMGEVNIPEEGCVSLDGQTGVIWPPGTRFGSDGRSLVANGALLVDGAWIEGGGGEVTLDLGDGARAHPGDGGWVWTEIDTVDRVDYEGGT